MRIVHFSDIHLSANNLHHFKHRFREALIKDLEIQNRNQKIDVIVVTGDLVDKSGKSLINPKAIPPENPYDLFEAEIIVPICKAINLDRKSFLFIPGNHDVDENSILLSEEIYLSSIDDDLEVQKILKENEVDYKHSKRIEKFKKFEKKFHESNSHYEHSPNQSYYIHNHPNGKVGFILVNDSWRCSSYALHPRGKEADLNKDKIWFGYHQVDEALSILDDKGTVLNICLMHHHLEDYNTKDNGEIKNILTTRNIEICLMGHHHRQSTDVLYTPFGTCHAFKARAALNNPDEENQKYLPGYQFYDIDLMSLNLKEVHYRKYDKDARKFIYDTSAADDGVDKCMYNKYEGFNLSGRDSKPRLSNLSKEDFKSHK